MKSVAILACLLVLAVVVNGDIRNQYAEAWTGPAEMCAKEIGLGTDIVKKFQTEKRSTDITNVGCLKACVLKKFDVIQNGKLVKNKMDIAIDTINANDPELAQKVKDLAGKCADKLMDITDECELALKFLNCCNDEGDRQHI